ncbi:metalloregulator ArsR/SmtB family transcription factor [Nonomuraea sp. NPDC001636]|uniref:ArsR/SmtB family transcription factor n=1 Tax=Nonomuraea sp. NPDC001636 TaxID=3154391 RepID=UPI00332E3D20
MPDDQLSLTFAALADPTRRAILARLADGEATVNELAEPFEMSLQAVSKHLKVLERAGLISRGRDAQWRPCRLETAPLEGASAWIDRYRERWTGSFDRLDEEIRKLRHSEEGRDHG